MAKRKKKDKPGKQILPKQVAVDFGFGGQQMRALYFDDQGAMIAKDLGRTTVLKYMSDNGIDPESTPMNLTRNWK